VNQNMPSKAPNRPVVGFSIPSWTRMGSGRPQSAAELEAKAAQLAAEAMRYRWQAQRMRSGV
jgi:hypothetical protein